jgi:aminoglycoside phosphotransferase (APT) family kinase protein
VVAADEEAHSVLSFNEHGLAGDMSLAEAQERLRAYAAERLGTNLEVVRLARAAGGSSNSTYAFDVVETDGPRSWPLIVRWDPGYGLVEPYNMARQFKVMHALQSSDVRVPLTYWLETDRSILGCEFYVVGKVDALIGDRVIVGSTPEEERRRRLAHVETLAAIHRTDWRFRRMHEFMDLPGQGNEYAFREVKRWEEVINRKLEKPDPLLEAAAAWMRENAIETDDVCLLHGDCSGTNYMYDGDEVVAVIDWEMSTLGDPMLEVGWYCGCIETLGVSINRLPPEEVSRARQEFLTMYEDATGRRMDHVKIKFGEVFYNYQLCSVVVSGDWMRRQRGEPPPTEPPGQNFRDQIARLIAY